MKETIKKSLLAGIVFWGTLIAIGVTYAAFVNITTVSTWETLNTSTINDLIANQIDINSRVWWGSIPTGFVWAFNGTSCPTGWNKADGSGDEKDVSWNNTTLDLRWEFVRGFDDGRGIDTGRTIGSWQIATSIHNDVIQAVHPVLSNHDGLWPTATVNRWSWQAWWNTSSTSRTVRPRNVSLLYCVKD